MPRLLATQYSYTRDQPVTMDLQSIDGATYTCKDSKPKEKILKLSEIHIAWTWYIKIQNQRRRF